MMRIVLSVISLALVSLLAACGADGEPQAPAQAGVAVTGSAYMGTSVRL